MTYRSLIPIYRAPAGTVFYKRANTYALEWCDICCQNKKCDWYDYEDPLILTGINCCRSCKAKALEEVDL